MPGKIGILVTATGDYFQYVQPLWESVSARFLPSYPKFLFLFTDASYPPAERNIHTFKISQRGFPGDTLYRYHHYASAIPSIRSQGINIVYALDVDMLVTATVGTEVLPTGRNPLVMVAHPGYAARQHPRDRQGTPETNPKSTAYIAPHELREYYVAGAFVGGFLKDFAELVQSIQEQIDLDDRNNILAFWHDESHLNRFYVNHRRQTKVLPPAYCHAENGPQEIDGGAKIVALSKQHRAIRNDPLRVSVIIPLYNGVEFLDECMASVGRQSYPYYEVLIGVNGHSRASDVFREAQKHADERVRVFCYDTQGAPMTCNRMKQDASYDLICMLDVDDMWAPGKLEAQISTFRRFFVDVIGTHCLYFGERTGSSKVPNGWIDNKSFLKSNPLINSSVMLQKHQVEWNDGHFVYDYELWFRMAYQDHRIFYNIGETLCYHRVHRDSFFNNRNDNAAMELRRHWARVLHKEEENRSAAVS